MFLTDCVLTDLTDLTVLTENIGIKDCQNKLCELTDFVG
jgi:hypothetical protein